MGIWVTDKSSGQMVQMKKLLITGHLSEFWMFLHDLSHMTVQIAVWYSNDYYY